MLSRPALAVVAASLGWGLASVGSRAVLTDGASTLTVVVVRTVVAAMGAIVVFGPRSGGFANLAWKRGALIGVIQVGVTPALFVAALNSISAGVEGLFITLIPVTTAVLAAAVLAEKLTPRQVAGLLLGLIGTAVLIVSGESGLPDDGDIVVGGALALGGVATGSIAAVLARRFSPEHETATLAVPMFVAGAVVVVALGVGSGTVDLGTLTGGSWTILVALGLGSTLLPFAATLYAARHLAAATVALTAYVSPLIGVIGGAVLLDEVITLPIILGGALVMTGVALASLPFRRPAPASGTVAS